MRISVICVGRVKEQYLRDAIAEYSKRLRCFCKLDIIEVADEKTPNMPAKAWNGRFVPRKAGASPKHIRPDAYVIALAIDGTMLLLPKGSPRTSTSSDCTAKATYSSSSAARSAWTTRSLRRADYRLSFSKMTFPHQLMRVILLGSCTAPTKSTPASHTTSSGGGQLNPPT